MPAISSLLIRLADALRRPRTDHQSAEYTAEQLVTTLYQAVLDRQPDQGSLQTYCEDLRIRDLQPEQLAASFFNSDEHRMRMVGPWGLRDYTQFGELGHLLRLLVRMGSEFQIVVDVGARGRDRSNSYNLLKEFGWKGLLIEANPLLVDSIAAEFEGLDYRLVNCAVSDVAGTMPFHIGINDDVSSLLPDHAAMWGEIKQVVEVNVERLSDVLRAEGIPPTFDILSLDIEGVDVRVLNDLVATSEYRPRLIIIEASYDFATRNLADAGLSEAVQSSYNLVGQTAANLILQKI